MAGLSLIAAAFLARLRNRSLLLREFRSDKKQRPQFHAIQEKRSAGVIERSITTPTIIPAAATSSSFAGGAGVRRAITCIARGPSVTIVQRIATSSAEGVRSRQPGMRSTLHDGAVRPHP